MKMKKLMTTLAIVSAVLFIGCKSDETNLDNPNAIPLQVTGQAAISLASASDFAIMAGTAITSTGQSSIIGDMGLSPGTSVGGFPPAVLVGSTFINKAESTQAKVDLTNAYNEAEGRTSTEMVTLSGNIGGLTLTPGLYKSNSTLAISSGDLTFDAKGNSSAIFILKVASTLTTSPGRKVILKGGAKAENIYWQVGSSATFGTTTEFKGTIMALQSITFNTGAKLEGRALAIDGAVVMDASTIVIMK